MLGETERRNCVLGRWVMSLVVSCTCLREKMWEKYIHGCTSKGAIERQDVRKKQIENMIRKLHIEEHVRLIRN